MKIKVLLTWNMCEEDEDFKFEDVSGEGIAEHFCQESANEIISSLDEFEEKETTVILVDDDGKIVKEKKVKINS